MKNGCGKLIQRAVAGDALFTRKLVSPILAQIAPLTTKKSGISASLKELIPEFEPETSSLLDMEPEVAEVVSSPVLCVLSQKGSAFNTKSAGREKTAQRINE